MTKLYWRLIHLGVHFGDTVSGNNFFTEPYVIGVRNGYYIIDLSKTIFMLRLAMRFIRKVSSLGGRTVMYYHTGFKYQILTIFLHKLSKLFSLSILYQRWIPGAISNYYICFYDLLNEVQDLNWIDARKRISFMSLFFRILYFTVIDLPVDTTIEEQYVKSLSYWRAIVFLRYFNSYYSLPDSAVCVDASYSTKICHEFCSVGIPVTSPLNTRSNLQFVSYPIISNNSSALLCLFYFSIFSSTIRDGRRSEYVNTFIDSSDMLKKSNKRCDSHFSKYMSPAIQNSLREASLLGKTQTLDHPFLIQCIAKNTSGRSIFMKVGQRKKKSRLVSLFLK